VIILSRAFDHDLFVIGAATSALLARQKAPLFGIRKPNSGRSEASGISTTG
jgi:hypothetical protein